MLYIFFTQNTEFRAITKRKIVAINVVLIKIKGRIIKQIVSERTRLTRLAGIPPGAKMFHDLIWDLGICSIESIEPYSIFIVPVFCKRSIYSKTSMY